MMGPSLLQRVLLLMGFEIMINQGIALGRRILMGVALRVNHGVSFIDLFQRIDWQLVDLSLIVIVYFQRFLIRHDSLGENWLSE